MRRKKMLRRTAIELARGSLWSIAKCFEAQQGEKHARHVLQLYAEDKGVLAREAPGLVQTRCFQRSYQDVTRWQKRLCRHYLNLEKSWMCV